MEGGGGGRGGGSFTSQIAFHIYVLDQYEFFEHPEEGCGI